MKKKRNRKIRLLRVFIYKLWKYNIMIENAKIEAMVRMRSPFW